MGAHRPLPHVLARWCYRCTRGLMAATNRGTERLWVCSTCRAEAERASALVEGIEQESGLILHDLAEAA